MKLINDIKEMTKYERYKLTVDFMRFMATMLAPFVIVGLQWAMKHFGGW